MPAITIVIPCFNAAPYLAEAVHSVLGQNVDAEVIVVDDASTDGSAAVAEGLAAAHGAVRVLHLPENRGSAAARNAGIAVARGRSIAFLDADDLYVDGWLPVGTRFLDENPGTAAVTCGMELLNCPHPVHPAQLHALESSSPSTLILRRTVVEPIGGFPDDPAFRTPLGGEDVAFRQALQRWFPSIARCDRAGLRYRILPGNHLHRFLDRSRIVDGRLQVDAPAHEAGHLARLHTALAAFADAVAARMRTPAIPKILHHTWKTADLPPLLRQYRESWRHRHPDWEHRLWTDADLRAFVAEHEPGFLPIYDGYPQPIRRVDAARYLIMRHLGGVFVDLDLECLRPIDDLIAGHGAVVGLEPAEHGNLAKATARGMTEILCPSFLASIPGHPFWDEVVRHLERERDRPDVLDATGPFLLTAAWRACRGGVAEPALVPPRALYPVDKDTCWSGALFDIVHWEQATRGAYALHHWQGTWFRDAPLQRVMPPRIDVQVTPGTDPAPVRAVAPDGRFPTISCLMVTKARPQAELAIACYRRQTYPARELVIVDDGTDDALERRVAALADPTIRYIRLPAVEHTLGALRNIAVEQARGTYICQWDDDDLYDPARLEMQMKTLRGAGSRACLLSRWMIWWPEAERLAVSLSRTWEGSLLCEKAVLPRYPELRRGEDSPVVERLCAEVRVTHLDLPRLYLYTAHGRNTFGSFHFAQHWEGATARWEGARGHDVLTELSKDLPIAAYRALLAGEAAAAA